MNEPPDPNGTADNPAGDPVADLTATFGRQAPRLATPASVPGSPGIEGSSSLAPPDPDPAASDFPAVPGYRVLREIARGGMGRVLAAHDLSLDRDVALKILLPGANADRFVRESKITARLPHPGIPPVHALGTLADRSPFLAMKLIAGRTLADELTTADRPRLLQAFTQVAQAVGFAHSRGVIHRDLKPANIMVGAFGEVQVMDWGLAKDLTSGEVPDQPRAPLLPAVPSAGTNSTQTTDIIPAGESPDHRTQAGAVLGTPAYMAPEQARGETADARADVFALGGILCVILTGKPPFPGKSALEVIQRAGAGDLVEAYVRLDSCGADAELVALSRRCLCPSPADRPAHGQEVADELTAYLNGVQQRLYQAELAATAARARAEEEAKRRRQKRALVAAVLVVLTAGVVVSGVLGMMAVRSAALADDERERADEKTHEAVRNEQRANREKEIATEQRARAELLVYAGKLTQAQLLWKDDRGHEALGILDECQWTLRGLEHQHLWTLYTSNQATFRGHTSVVRSVSWSPDGKRIVSGSEDNSLKIWDADTGQQALSLRGHTRGVVSVSWSPDGKRIASGSADNTLKVWDAGKGRELFTLKGHSREVLSVSWSPDGKRIASGSADNTLKVWDAGKGRELFTLKGHSREVLSVSWSPDGKRIASGSHDNSLKVWDADKGQEALALKGHTDGVWCVVWSPDGKRIASASYSTLRVWDADKGLELLSLKGHTRAVTSVAWSPDGQRILSGSQDSTLKVWDADKSQEVLAFKGHTSRVWNVSWSPDGKRIVSGSEDKSLKIWDADKGLELLALKGHIASVNSVSWSPDGKRVVSGSYDRTLKVWDADTGTATLTLKGHTGYVTSVAFSPDGKRILSGSSDSTLKIWDSDKGLELVAFGEYSMGVNSVSWSPDGKRILSGSLDSTLKVWETDKGQVLLALKDTSSVYSVAWSPDGKRVLSSGESTLKVWDANKRQDVLSLKALTGPVSNVSWSPDGKRISGKDFNGKIFTWDAMTGQSLLAADPISLELKSEATSPEGSLRAFIEFGQIKVVRLADFVDAQKREQEQDRLFLESLTRSLPDHHYQKANLYEKSEDHFATAFHLRRLLEVRPSYAVLLRRRGPFNHQEESGLLVMAACDAAILQEPNNPALPLRRGLVRSRMGSPGARADLDRAFELSRDDPAVMLARSLIEARAGRPAQARSLQEKALRQTAMPTLDSGRGWDGRPQTATPRPSPETDAIDTVLALEEELGWEGRVAPHQVARALAAGSGLSEPWGAALNLAFGPRSPQETAPAWRWCGLARCARGDWERAIHDLDATLAMSPGDLLAGRSRARAHAELLQWDRAIADCTGCLKVQPDSWELWYLRAVAHHQMYRHDLALDDLTRALAQRGDGLALREALPDYRLRAAPYRMRAGQLAYNQKRFAAATQLWAEALLVDEYRRRGYLYKPACAAVLAAAGQGKDESPLADAAKAKLRRQALDWLKAELIAWGKLLASGTPRNLPRIMQTLRYWQKDTDLATIRDPAALAKLSADEQKAFTQLWTDVAALLKKAEEKPK